MNKEDYIKVAKKKIKNKNARKIMLEQIENYYSAKKTYICKNDNYTIGDSVKLKKGTLLHGTYKNMDGLKVIVNSGLVSSWFIDGRLSKYPSSAGVWKLKEDYLLKDYINYYSGGTIEYGKKDGQVIKTEVIPYDAMNKIMEKITSTDSFRWYMEQTKEARFMPSLIQNEVQIGIIFNGNSNEIKTLLKGDILSDSLSDKEAKEFVNKKYYDKFIIDRKNKNDFFTDRESAILFGIPENFIEGILVGREYEKEESLLKEIKKLLPNCYICNLNGIVIA